MYFKECLCFGGITCKKTKIHLLHFRIECCGLLKFIFTDCVSLFLGDGEHNSQMLCLKSLGQRPCSGVGAVNVIKCFVFYFIEWFFKELMWLPHVPVQLLVFAY